MIDKEQESMIIRFDGYNAVLFRILRSTGERLWVACIMESLDLCVVVVRQAPGDAVSDAVLEYHSEYLPAKEEMRHHFPNERKTSPPWTKESAE